MLTPENFVEILFSNMLITIYLVGEFSRGDTSIQITGLKPGHYYNVRVIATNVANFSSLGPLIRLRTAPMEPARTNGAPLQGDIARDSSPVQSEPASIRANPSHFEQLSIAASPHMRREPSVGHSQVRRTACGRRNSPAASTNEQGIKHTNRASSSDEDESGDTIRRLTETLDSLRYDQQEIDKLISEEELESKKSMVELVKERDRLRQFLKEKEEASSELRKHGNHLDKLNRTAQSKKAAKEKTLDQKKAERQKMKNDVARWDREIIEMQRDAEEMVKERAAVVMSKDNEVTEIRKGIGEDQFLIKSLEEDIRVKGIHIKTMEKEIETPESDENEEQGHVRAEKEKDEAWEAKSQEAQAHLSTLWHNLQQVSRAPPLRLGISSSWLTGGRLKLRTSVRKSIWHGGQLGEQGIPTCLRLFQA